MVSGVNLNLNILREVLREQKAVKIGSIKIFVHKHETMLCSHLDAIKNMFLSNLQSTMIATVSQLVRCRLNVWNAATRQLTLFTTRVSLKKCIENTEQRAFYVYSTGLIKMNCDNLW